ncbi:MAG: ABC transporter ATP-binding protein [Gemmatimonadetes bacterium]|nr:MAG: ABC transporter ATP-binding protein [Gemmatimonadota bacterium]
MRIRAEGLTKEFSQGARVLRVLDAVDLDVAPRESVAVVGPSGSGKTTLLGLLAGLDRPTAGRVVLGDTELGPLTEDERAVFRARHVGFVFQSFHLLPTLTALENVMVPAELLGGAPLDAVRARAGELLARVGLEDRMGHYPAQLSGGERQRVAVARAFVNRPGILFADEPTGNLDRRTGERVVALLEELNHDLETTLVLVTHDLGLAERMARVVSLDDGRVVASRASAVPGSSPEVAERNA